MDGEEVPQWATRLRFAETFGMSPQDVGGVKLVWWHRWLEWVQAQAVQDAYISQRNYRDKDGRENWAEWAKQHPKLSSRLRWALDNED